VLFRFLRRSGHAVRYVRNFTDIDDKIINRAKESREGEEASSSSFDVAAACSSLTERMIAEFHDDVDALRCLRPTSEPRATAFVSYLDVFFRSFFRSGI
jgi:cysteinyl-tRNA synthetase